VNGASSLPSGPCGADLPASPPGRGWAFRIEDLEAGRAWFFERRYGSEDAARADALLAVKQLQEKSAREAGVTLLGNLVPPTGKWCPA